jgi:hypothetical protein
MIQYTNFNILFGPKHNYERTRKNGSYQNKEDDSNY